MDLATDFVRKINEADRDFTVEELRRLGIARHSDARMAVGWSRLSTLLGLVAPYAIEATFFCTAQFVEARLSTAFRNSSRGFEGWRFPDSTAGAMKAGPRMGDMAAFEHLWSYGSCLCKPRVILACDDHQPTVAAAPAP